MAAPRRASAFLRGGEAEVWRRSPACPPRKTWSAWRAAVGTRRRRTSTW
uniref:Uncharacterized protein n=1 Tax=Arundo donax TaxID=35708 RepID=A0A0A9ALP8_ARUDO